MVDEWRHYPGTADTGALWFANAPGLVLSIYPGRGGRFWCQVTRPGENKPIWSKEVRTLAQAKEMCRDAAATFAASDEDTAEIDRSIGKFERHLKRLLAENARLAADTVKLREERDDAKKAAEQAKRDALAALSDENARRVSRGLEPFPIPAELTRRRKTLNRPK